MASHFHLPARHRGPARAEGDKMNTYEEATRAAVEAYLQTHFGRDAQISGDFDGDRSTRWWRVTTSETDVLLQVSLEFLRDYSPSAAVARLEHWSVSDELKDAAPARFILVTRDGCRAEAW